SCGGARNGITKTLRLKYGDREMDLFERMIETERTLWTNDLDVYEAAYDENAILIFPEAGKIGRAFAVAAIKDENRNGKHWAEVHFEGVVPSQLSAEVVQLVYRGIARWNYETTASSAYCTTIYIKKGDLWKVVFHQQTPIPMR